jgi:DnaJ-class molecular chaperone
MNKKENIDYYKVLGIQKSSNDDQIKKAYKKLAMENHPDLNKSKFSTQKFSLIAEGLLLFNLSL